MKLRATVWSSLVLLLTAAVMTPTAAGDQPNNLVSLLSAGKPAVGVWTGATGAPRDRKSVV